MGQCLMRDVGRELSLPTLPACVSFALVVVFYHVLVQGRQVATLSSRAVHRCMCLDWCIALRVVSIFVIGLMCVCARCIAGSLLSVEVECILHRCAMSVNLYIVLVLCIFANHEAARGLACSFELLFSSMCNESCCEDPKRRDQTKLVRCTLGA
eukprot:3696234-Amphidinium_carterae.2